MTANERSKLYYQENKEKVIKRVIEYQKQNIEKRKIWSKAFYEKHKKEILKKNKEKHEHHYRTYIVYDDVGEVVCIGKLKNVCAFTGLCTRQIYRLLENGKPSKKGFIIDEVINV